MRLNRHIHRDTELRMLRPLHGVRRDDVLTGLIAKQIDRVRGVMPEQMIGPGAWLAERIGVRATKEERLNIHVLNLQLARNDLLVHPLM